MSRNIRANAIRTCHQRTWCALQGINRIPSYLSDINNNAITTTTWHSGRHRVNLEMHVFPTRLTRRGVSAIKCALSKQWVH